MKINLVTGACGFVGRNMVKRLYNTTTDHIFMVDDLSIGIHPREWFTNYHPSDYNGLEVLDPDKRVYFWKGDLRELLFNFRENPRYIQDTYNLDFDKFSDVFHFAAIVGGRMKIDGDPIQVGLDLSIDAELFYWAVRNMPDRLLYPSSSAAYPVDLQTEDTAIALKEEYIDFDSLRIGVPDMTYGWSKLTGEFLAKIAAKHYGLKVVCIRPFSGYGEDQDLSYPVPALAARAAAKEDPFVVWGTGKQARDFIHIDDIIDFIFVLMDNVQDGSGWNIGSGKLTSFLEIIDLFSKFAGYKPTIQPLIDKPMGVHSRYADMTKVFSTFDWRPKISLEDGMYRVYKAQLDKLNQNK